jgi:hypothetical protein
VREAGPVGSWKARLLAVGFGSFVALAIVAVAEIGFCRANARRPEPTWAGSYVHGFFLPDGQLGYRAAPNRETTCQRSVEGKTLFNVVYRTDGLGRRVTPATGSTKPSRHAIFFGCSLTFGEGVEDAETLPAQFASVAPEFRSYNYGFVGYGPQQTLGFLLDPGFRQQISEAEGAAFYTYIVGHEDRAIGRMSVVTSWGKGMPCWEEDSTGALDCLGSFASAHPIRQRLYEIAAMSETLKFFKIDFPLRRTEAQFRLVARILAEAAHQYRAVFGSNHFYVVLFPSIYRDFRVVPYLRRWGVPVLDYSHLFDPTSPGLFIEGDRHPTAEAYRRVANHLAQDHTARQ